MKKEQNISWDTIKATKAMVLKNKDDINNILRALHYNLPYNEFTAYVPTF